MEGSGENPGTIGLIGSGAMVAGRGAVEDEDEGLRASLAVVCENRE